VRSAFFLVVALCLGAATARQSELDSAAVAFSRAWSAGNAEAIAGALVPEGIRLQLGGETHMGLPSRQARAALTEFLSSRATGRLDPPRVAELGGEPRRGSAEFRWQTVVRGTSEPLSHTIFVGFTRVGNGWRISEIRVF